MASVNRGILRSIAVLALLGLLITGANLVLTARAISSDDHKWCDTMTLLTATPVPSPADARANPSREQNYKFYMTFVHLRHSLGC